MKSKLLLCVAAFAVVGCASNQNPSPEYIDLEFTSDLVPPPVEGMSEADAERIYSPAPASPSRAGGQNN